MPRLPLAALAAVLAGGLAGCDFTTSLDIDTPEYEPRAVINAVLQTDSVATVRIDVSTDPYSQSTRDYGPRPTRTDATVTLLRDGQPVETLAVRSETCDDYSSRDPETGSYRTFECGPYAGTVPLEAGATYTVRVELPGVPTAEGTVTMPARPTVAVEELEPEGRERRFRVRLSDPGGSADRYGVALLREQERVECDPDGCFPNGTFDRQPVWFDTSDPVILSAVRQVPGEGIYFATVTDQTFDGRTWAFTISENDDYYYGDSGPVVVQVAALSGDVYDVYQIEQFGNDGDDNPFAEPTNRPSNVEGGYGLVGAVAVAEARFDPPAE